MQISNTSSYIDASDLFTEFFQLPDARRFRQALYRSRAWRLEPGETLKRDDVRGACVVLAGEAHAVGQPQPVEGARKERIFGHWTGLRGQLLPHDITTTTGAVVMECDRDTLALLVCRNNLGSTFKVEFFRTLACVLEPLADVPEEVLDRVIRSSAFCLYAPGEPIVREGDIGNTMFFLLAGTAEVARADGARPVIEQGGFFGELAVITQQRRTATVSAKGDCLVMECTRAAVADLRKKSKRFREQIQTAYRAHMMLSQLARAALFQGLSTHDLEAIRDIGELVSFDPYQPVVYQGDEPDAFFMVLNGTMQAVQMEDERSRARGWVRAGETVGEMSLLRADVGGRRGQTVSAVQSVDAIRIPADSFCEILQRYPQVAQRIRETAAAREEANAEQARDERRADAVAWMMETEHLSGEAVLAVDMNDCIRCGNCVAACQAVHPDGLNRFFWDAMRQDDDVMPQVRLSSSCQHCEYALCMRACPTNALERTAGLAVYIDYEKCIRCGKCADPSQGCPYGSIQIVPADQVTLSKSKPFLLGLLSYFSSRETATAPGGPAKSANEYPVKCDLCHTQRYQACVEYCPTDAVFRLDGHQQFAATLDRPLGNGGGSRPAGEAGIPLYVRAAFDERSSPAAAGRPAEMKIAVSREGPGLRILCRPLESGVTSIRLNLYLDVPYDFTVGRGGSLRQMVLPLDSAGSEDHYPITARAAGRHSLRLVAYQGSFYLGHQEVTMEVAPAAPKA